MKDFNNNLKTAFTIVDNCLIVTLPGEMTDEELEIISSNVILNANKGDIKGAILDFSMVYTLDTYIFRVLEKTAKAISLLGLSVVWTGLKPGIVTSLLDLNLDVSKIKAALNLEQGLQVIKNIKR